jgi:hypothetical protein
MIMSHWYYNTESGALTNGNFYDSIGYEFEQVFGGAGWHELNIAGTATETQAAAEAVKEFPSGAAPTTSVAAQAANTAGGASFTDTAHALAAFYDKITDYKMWRSLGWLVAGFLLMIAGVALLLKGTIKSQIVGAL